MVTIHHTTNLDTLTTEAAEKFIELVVANPQARVVLTGGTAGIETLRKIRERAEQVNWAQIHVFFGDERNVPVSHPDSNEGQAREALLDHIDIPAENIHGYELGDVDMETSVERYTAALAEYAPNGFDLHLLGMGPEGHINTLFPHTEAVAEQSKLVVAEYASPKPPPERVTLTLAAVARADRVWFLVSGADKAEAAGHVARGADPAEWPAAGAKGSTETVLFVSEDAATHLPG